MYIGWLVQECSKLIQHDEQVTRAMVKSLTPYRASIGHIHKHATTSPDETMCFCFSTTEICNRPKQRAVSTGQNGWCTLAKMMTGE